MYGKARLPGHDATAFYPQVLRGPGNVEVDFLRLQLRRHVQSYLWRSPADAACRFSVVLHPMQPRLGHGRTSAPTDGARTHRGGQCAADK